MLIYRSVHTKAQWRVKFLVRVSTEVRTGQLSLIYISGFSSEVLYETYALISAIIGYFEADFHIDNHWIKPLTLLSYNVSRLTIIKTYEKVVGKMDNKFTIILVAQ